ncbi:MAG: hypothetical protein FWD78_13100 [Treponema sp.]|nr:hypothetical protein [Treponema sp.]
MNKRNIIAFCGFIVLSVLVYGQNNAPYASFSAGSAWTEEIFQNKYNVPLNEFFPKDPQPFTFIIVRDEGSQMGIDRDDIRDASERTDAQLFEQIDLIIKAIQKLSDNVIEFTGDPDKASGILHYKVTYPFYGTYGTSVRGYSCRFNIDFFQFGANKAFMGNYFIKNPEQTVSIRAGSSMFWEDPPDLDTSGMQTLVNAVLASRDFRLTVKGR